MKDIKLSNAQLNVLVLLRILIGWHFLYEGVIKVYNPSWTAKAYLLSSEGIFKPFFELLAHESVIGLVDGINIAILLIAGACLILGVMVRHAALSGAVLLLLYYLSHPALPGFNPGPAEGSYWIVNKNLIEAAALLVLMYLPTAHHFSVLLLFKKNPVSPTVQPKTL